MKHWFDRHPDRLRVEASLVGRVYPEAKMVKKDGQIRVLVNIRGGDHTYRCELVYPRQFPNTAIEVYIRSPEVKSKFHQYPNGRLCLNEPHDVNPSTTALVYLEWTRGWIKRYEESRRTGKWRD